jgi:hypothetical protein
MWVIGIPLLAASAVFAVGCLIAARHVFSRWGALTARQRWRVVTCFLAIAVFVLGFANAVLFFTVSVAIGGDAAAGQVEGGRYYVASHGRPTEVSRDVWEYSRWHATVTWVTFLLSALALAFLMLSARLFGTHRPVPLTITVRRDGAILVDGQSVAVEQAVGRAEAARAVRQEVHVRREYPPGEPPPEAVRLCHELIGRNVLFQPVDGRHPP